MNKKTPSFSFTIPSDIQAKADDLTIEEMTSLMLQLESTMYWPALIRYLQERFMLVQQSLYTLDPMKDQTVMCRQQGIMSGLVDIQNFIYQAKAHRDERSKAEQERKDANKQ